MEIFGVGSGELIAILIIMLIVVGPKRMIQWAYILGQYTTKLRTMWAETMGQVEKELRASGIDVDLPRDIPSRGVLNQQIAQHMEKVLNPVTQPLKDVLEETGSELNEVKNSVVMKESVEAAPVSHLDIWSNPKLPKDE